MKLKQEVLAALPPEPRYQVVPFSESVHCCFEASVVDVSTRTVMNDGFVMFEGFCECFTLEAADLIAAALNKEGEA